MGLRALLLLLCVAAASCGEDPAPPPPEAGREPVLPPEPVPEADYVGRNSCELCHADQVEAWTGSDHDRAMDEATDETVLGDFDDATFEHFGVTSRFFKRDGRHFVRTEGPDGGLEDYPVAYTFGVDPLQQYLVEFPGGRYQMLPLCWDSRPVESGGQRWFHIYPDERIPPGDPLYWTSPNQNWNFMCADCHSTDLARGYRPEEDRFETTWAEIDVSCEACHGPASKHVMWAEGELGIGEEIDDPEKGLVVQLWEDEPATWIVDGKTGNATRKPPRKSWAELMTCAPCHSRRSAVTTDYVHDAPFLDTHRPALLDELLYFPDGQILDEVYVFGSFVQSKMYRKGVSCTDCHDPHSLKLKAVGNTLCTRCHVSSKFNVVQHHHHQPGQPGSLCRDCHMPERSYMVVDPRADHSLRIPRPDLSAELGTPNACNLCHDDQTPEWAAGKVEEWFGPDRPVASHYGEALHGGRTGRPGAPAALAEAAGDPEVPGIARATSLMLLGRWPDPAARPAIRKGLADPDPLVRLGALEGLGFVPGTAPPPLVLPLLKDPIRAVRIRAGRVLASADTSRLAEADRAAAALALAEWRRAQEVNADRADAHLNLALLHLDQGDQEGAEGEYRRALELDPAFSPASVNLADLYRVQGREREAEAVLRKALEHDPRNGALHHSLGLLLVRVGEPAKGLEALARAAGLQPAEPRYAYVFAVALHSRGEVDRAIGVLREAGEQHPWNQEILSALATYLRDAGRVEDALPWARRLQQLLPEDPAVASLVEELEAGGR